MSGAEVFERLLQVNPEARVVLCSGYDEMDALTSLKKREFLFGFLKKPFDEQSLISAVRKALIE
jgi:FixJ family two-component response regulator